MNTRDLPLNTWMVVEQGATGHDVRLVSQHSSQAEAEKERDKRNQALSAPHYNACIVLEPIAQRMGGQFAPTASKPHKSTTAALEKPS